MKFSKLFWMGLLIFVLTGLFLIGIMYIQDLTIKKSNYSFTVIFANVQGLNEGDDVNMLGKRIGKVSRAKIIGQKIAVELSIDNSNLDNKNKNFTTNILSYILWHTGNLCAIKLFYIF